MLKKMLCLLVVLILALPALAETPYDSVRVRFEDGFSLSLPSDWVSYEVSPEEAKSGIIYCLGSADAERLLYIQRWSADFEDIDALRAELEADSNLVLRSDSTATSPFLMYNLADSDASGCITLFADGVLNLLFLPQSDAENMLLAATIIESYALNE